MACAFRLNSSPSSVGRIGTQRRKAYRRNFNWRQPRGGQKVVYDLIHLTIYTDKEKKTRFMRLGETGTTNSTIGRAWARVAKLAVNTRRESSITFLLLFLHCRVPRQIVFYSVHGPILCIRNLKTHC